MRYNTFIKEYVKPYLKMNDKPFNRQLFHEQKDILHKEGIISDRQVQNWLYPNTKQYV